MKETRDSGTEPGSEPSSATGGGGSRWLRRRLLRWALGLAPVAAGGGWATLRYLDNQREARAARWTQEAAWLCFARNPDAGGPLGHALEAAASYAPAHLLRACWLMETGDWYHARTELSSPPLRRTPEGNLLWGLCMRRPRPMDWRQAFLEAWAALGRPDFGKSSLLPAPLTHDIILPYTHGELEQLDEPRRLPMVTVVPGEEPSHPEWGLEQIRASDSIPLLMALRERLFVIEEGNPIRQRLRPAVEERLEQLTGPSPRTLQLALRAFLASRPRSSPLERQDLEVLEQWVTLEWKQPSSEHFFLEMRERFEGLLMLPGHHAWVLATWAHGLSTARELIRRAQASAPGLSEDERRWMGRLLWEVGARLREQRSRLELEWGLLIQIYGGELTGHSDTRMDALSMWMELGEWEDALKRAAWSRWPLPSMQEESCEPRARDEHAWMRAFAGKGELT